MLTLVIDGQTQIFAEYTEAEDEIVIKSTFDNLFNVMDDKTPYYRTIPDKESYSREEMKKWIIYPSKTKHKEIKILFDDGREVQLQNVQSGYNHGAENELYEFYIKCKKMKDDNESENVSIDLS